MAQQQLAKTGNQQLSTDLATSVADAIQRQILFPKAGPAPAAKAAAQLLSFYPTHTANEPEKYAAAIVALMAEYPREVIDVVVDPRRGLATRCKFLPTLAELTEALQSEMEPHNQAWIKEREKRNAIPRMDRTPPTAEEKARVQKILKDTANLGKTDPIEELRKEARAMRANNPTQ